MNFLKLDNGEEKLFGPYETSEELLAAVDSFAMIRSSWEIWIRVRPVKLLVSAYKTKLHEHVQNGMVALSDLQK